MKYKLMVSEAEAEKAMKEFVADYFKNHKKTSFGEFVEFVTPNNRKFYMDARQYDKLFIECLEAEAARLESEGNMERIYMTTYDDI